MTLTLPKITFSKKVSDTAGYIHLACALWLTVTLLFHFHIQYWALVAYFTTYIIDYICSERWKEFRWTLGKYVYVAFILFFLLIPIWQLFDSTLPTAHYKSVLESRLPFIAFGLMGILGMSKKYKLRYFGYTMIATAALTSLWLIFVKIGIGDFLTSTNKTLAFQEVRIKYVASHMVYNLYLNTALIFAFYIIREIRKRLIPKTFVWIGAAIILYILFISEGRTGFLSAIGVLIFFLVYCVWNWKKRYVAVAAFFAIIAFVLILPTNKRFTEVDPLSNIRLEMWRVCLNMIDENPWLGYGVSSARVEYVKQLTADPICYDRYVEPEILNNPLTNGNPNVMHPHNAYIESILEFGILGIALFLFILVYPLLMFPKKRKIYMLLYIGCFAMQAMFETLGQELRPMSFCLAIMLWHQGSFYPNNDALKEELEEEEANKY